MEVTQILRELTAVKKKHEGREYDTFATNVHAMASDCIETIEELQRDLEAAKQDLQRLKNLERLRVELRGDICE